MKLLFEWLSQGTLTTGLRNAVGVEKNGKVIGLLPRGVAIVLFFEERRKRSLHCDSTAVQFFVGLIVRRA